MEPALATRLTKLDVTARMWETLFPILSGVGVILIGLLVGLMRLGDIYVVAGLLIMAGGGWVVVQAARVLRMTLRARRILRVEPWVERRIDFYVADRTMSHYAAAWVRSKPEEPLWIHTLPLEQRRLAWVGEDTTVWIAGSGQWRVISPVGGGTTRLAMRAEPGDARFGKIVSMTPRGDKRAERLIRATRRAAG
ncbi:hypothetical protein [Actinokineospora sp. HUAS TT18]|uniref:hypothetical protein n=1 Tax=Actinokineospora sp. HUAS TT18 TaxID=3447451 RepID=UPI003F51AFDE